MQKLWQVHLLTLREVSSSTELGGLPHVWIKQLEECSATEGRVDVFLTATAEAALCPGGCAGPVHCASHLLPGQKQNKQNPAEGFCVVWTSEPWQFHRLWSEPRKCVGTFGK